MVDDNVQMTELFRQYFEKEDILIEFADDGLKGIKKALTTDYKMIIMDLNMPGVDGIDATMQIRQHEKKRNYICGFTADTQQPGLTDKKLFDVVLDKKKCTTIVKIN